MIHVKIDGRLGNQMFQYAVCRAVAKRREYNFSFPLKGDEYIINDEGHHLTDYFDVDTGVRDAPILGVYWENWDTLGYDEAIFSVADFSLLVGFFQSERYFEGIEDEVRSWFRPKYETKAGAFLSERDPEDHCFIHFRGGDYRGKDGWILGMHYFREAMSAVESARPGVRFVVVTDDVPLASEMFGNIECVRNDMMTDFEILKSAKQRIISNSTFSWWASWLAGDSLTVAPDRWINHNRPGSGFFPADIRTEKFLYV